MPTTSEGTNLERVELMPFFKQSTCQVGTFLSLICTLLTYEGGGPVFGNAGTYPLEGGYMYITPVGYPTLAYSFGKTSSGTPAFTLVGQSPDVSAGRVGTGSATITTYQGQAGTGILWVVDPDAGLRAYNAVPSNGQLIKLTLPPTPSVSKFQRPAFGDGRYYLSTSNGKILVRLTYQTLYLFLTRI